MTTANYSRTRLACYTANFTISTAFSLPPLLFMPLREMFGISFTLLGTLVLINFCTQLGIDLIFTVFSKHFNVKKVVTVMPLITSAGLVVYALVPTLFPNLAYVGLAAGTVIFSVSAGLAEVLISPVIAAIPSDNPQRDMSFLHSLYAFGVFTVVVISTLFLKIFGNENWMYLTLLLALFPIIAAVMFMTSPMPDMDSGESSSDTGKRGKRALGLALCVGCIFFGSCAENAISNWISSYMENALQIDKTLGDILGMAMFAIILGLSRMSYAKFGKNICRVLLIGMIGSVCCYLVAGLSTNVAFAFIACVLTGMFSAMLWPGTLIMMEEKLPGAGVAAFALMAAGGDLGASIAPQLVGIVADKVAVSDIAVKIGNLSGLTADQIGLKAGMLVTVIFPLIGAVCVISAMIYFKRMHNSQSTIHN